MPGQECGMGQEQRVLLLPGPLAEGPDFAAGLEYQAYETAGTDWS